jgi:PAS domain S-box-containing protein
MSTAVEPVRVLHVGDGSSLAALLRGDTELAFPIDVQTAATSTDGRQQLADREIDCIVVDHDPPTVDGIELLEAVREDHPSLPFVLRTDGGSEKLASDAISADVSEYLHTTQETELRDRIVELVEQFRVDRERERELERTSDLLAKTERIADVGGWEIDTETNEVFWTDHLFELLGVEGNEEPPLDEALDVYHEEDRPIVESAVEDALEDGDPFDTEVRFHRPDGEIRWLRVQGVPAVENGRVETLRGAVQDITERKHRQQEHERLSDLLSKTEQIADVGGWELNAETLKIFWTDNLFKPQGIDAVEEPPLDEALSIYHEEDRQIVADAVEAALDDAEPFDVKARYRRSDGEIRWFRIKGVPAVTNGRVETVRGAVQDITERHTREHTLREMHDIISDRDHSFDEQVRQLLELGRRELDTEYGTLSRIDDDDYTFEIVVADDDSIQDGDMVPVSTTNCEIAASTKRTLVLGNVERDAPEQTHRAGFAELGISCYLGAPVFVDDEVYGTFCFYDTEARADQFSEWETTLVDLMSRWVSYELQRRQVTQQLHEQNEQLERFASIVSHDLRNPLGIIDGYVDIAVETGDVSELDRVQAAVERMDTLIDDVLLLSRTENAISDRSTVELRSFAEQCWENVPTEAATVSIRTDRTVDVDETRLQQLFENLIRNAVEHGGESVQVTVGDLVDGFYIEDDGPGIPAEDRETVFQGGYSTSHDGTGLGLSIVKEIVEAHGWTIEVTEATEGGARFEITGVDTVETE